MCVAVRDLQTAIRVRAACKLAGKEMAMPRGDKSAYTDKQKRQAEHIEEGYEDRGVSNDEAERRAWATVNKQDHTASRAVRAAPTMRSTNRPE